MTFKLQLYKNRNIFAVTLQFLVV